jgi:hypothetical protein
VRPPVHEGDAALAVGDGSRNRSWVAWETRTWPPCAAASMRAARLTGAP